MSSIPFKSKLDEYAKLGLVRSQTHPELPLTIYVYTEFTTHERLWNSVTRACRGLVVDDKDRCIVRCLPKFFNEGEEGAMIGLDPTLESVAYNKLDGSLIQVVNDKEYGLVVTSKGSFASDQAKWAMEIIAEKYKLEDFDQDKTYIFELIHPENRIVLDYEGTRDLFLLAVVETHSGKEFDIYGGFGKFPKTMLVPDPERYMQDLVEGVVIKTGTHRYKIKTGEYLRLHRIVTDFTPKRVWEALMNGDSLEFENMPEEFEDWLRMTTAEFKDKFKAIEEAVLVENGLTEALTDKELGLAKNVKYKSYLFMIRKGIDPSQSIWRSLKPRKETIDETIDA